MMTAFPTQITTVSFEGIDDYLETYQSPRYSQAQDDMITELQYYQAIYQNQRPVNRNDHVIGWMSAHDIIDPLIQEAGSPLKTYQSKLALRMLYEGYKNSYLRIGIRIPPLENLLEKSINLQHFQMVTIE